MTYLAVSNRKQSSKEISKNTKIAHPTVTKLLKILSNADFLSSELGSNGGYALAKPASQITLLDIISSIEGNFSLTECSNNTTDCNVFSNCGISSHWRIINVSIKESLQKVTLYDLTVKSSIKPRNNLMNAS